jgi:iron complex transport system substrate-binding protein
MTRLWCIGWLAALLCSVAAAAPELLRDDRGTVHRFAAPPQRIVSLLPSLSEAVCALGACERLVGVDRWSNWPAALAALPRVGGLEDAQIEHIVSLRPDVVLAAPSARVIERLEALGLKVVVLDAQNHGDVHRALLWLAQLLGRPAQGPALWAAIERDLAAAAARVPAGVRGQRVYFEVGSGPYAAGAASFIGQTLARLGLVNIVPAEMGPFPLLSPEFVLRARPELMMAGRREWQAMPSRPGWQGPNAPRVRGCGFDSAQYDVLVRPGPRLGEAALQIADCLAALERVK